MSLKNYFFGTEIIDFYNELKKKHPEESKRLNWERNKYIFFGKIIPNIMDLGGLVALFLKPMEFKFGGALSIGAGESLRDEVEMRYRDKKLDYICKENKKEINETINFMRKNPEKIREKFHKS